MSAIPRRKTAAAKDNDIAERQQLSGKIFSVSASMSGSAGKGDAFFLALILALFKSVSKELSDCCWVAHPAARYEGAIRTWFV